MTSMAGFGGNTFVRARLQAALYENRKRNKERQAEQDVPEPEVPDPETEE